MITAAQVIEFFEQNAKQNNGAVLLIDETISDIAKSTTPPLLADIDETGTTGDALATFFPKGNRTQRPQFLIVKNKESIVGVIQNPVVKYQ